MAISFLFFFTIHQLNKRRNVYTNISKHNNKGLKGQIIFKGIYITKKKTDVRKPHRLRSNASTYWLQRELQLKHRLNKSGFTQKQDQTASLMRLLMWLSLYFG